MNMYGISSRIQEEMDRLGIDRDLTLSILDACNAGKFDHHQPVKASAIPELDGKQLIDMTRPSGITLPAAHLRQRLQELFGDEGRRFLPETAADDEGEITVPAETISDIGVRLFGKCAYGILNGGSATSYGDEKKNRGFNKELFSLYEPYFHRFSPDVRGKAKGVTPAFINPDGSPGPSYLELKLRALLIGALKHRKNGGNSSSPLPLFQMTSASNNDDLADAFRKYRESPLLKDLSRVLNMHIDQIRTGIQPLIAAYTHSREGRPKKLFTRAFGKEGTLLPLPGGHGQNFIALRGVYQELRREGYRYAMLGNVDNLGTTPDPNHLGYLALSGKHAAFEFSFKTGVDVKGGVLVRDQHGRLTCADIGPAISRETVEEREHQGSAVLFNCASAIFDLDFLCSNLDRIIETLPTRFTDQEKDAGAYSQAEQVTWEIIGMLEEFLIFAVKKEERFLAAKMLMDTFLTSGLELDNPVFPPDGSGGISLKELAWSLHRGLEVKLKQDYGMKLNEGRWFPLNPQELEERIP